SLKIVFVTFLAGSLLQLNCLTLVVGLGPFQICCTPNPGNGGAPGIPGGGGGAPGIPGGGGGAPGIPGGGGGGGALAITCGIGGGGGAEALISTASNTSFLGFLDFFSGLIDL